MAQLILRGSEQRECAEYDIVVVSHLLKFRLGVVSTAASLTTLMDQDISPYFGGSTR